MLNKEELDLSRIPQHVAIIMDGNGRWAKLRGQERSFGHQAGAETVHIIAEEASKLGIKYLTLYTFSTENWNRPSNEVAALMAPSFRFYRRRNFHEEQYQIPNHRRPDQVARQRAGTLGNVCRAYRQQHRNVSGTGYQLLIPLGNNGSYPPNCNSNTQRRINSRTDRQQSGIPASYHQLYARSRSVDTYGRRSSSKQLPALAMRLLGALFLRHLLAGLS